MNGKSKANEFLRSEIPATPSRSSETHGARDSRPLSILGAAGNQAVQRLEREAAEVSGRMAQEGTHSLLSDSGASQLARSGGVQPLPAPARSVFERELGVDLGGTRIHTSLDGQKSARSLGAKAYASGQDIVFSKGRFSPDTPEGFRLLAHETAHVAQYIKGSAPAGSVLRQDEEPDPFTPEGRFRIASDAFYGASYRALREAALSEDEAALLDEAFSAALLESLLAALPFGIEDVEMERLTRRTQEVAGLRQTLNSTDESLGLVEALFRIMHARAEMPNAAELLMASMSRNMAEWFAGYMRIQDPDFDWSMAIRAFGPLGSLRWDLEFAVRSLEEPITALQLELEGAIDLLLQARRAFATAEDQRQRQAFGANIGIYSRQALMINDSLQRLLAIDEDDRADTPLDEQMAEVDSDLDSIAETSRSESDTHLRMGDDLSLLSARNIALPEALYPEFIDSIVTLEGPQPGVAISPEQAFPLATDTAVNEMMADLDERVAAQSSEVGRLRESVIPSSPSYNLDEFAAVFHRWAAFFSVEQEMEDPIISMWMELLGEPYRMMGSSALELHPSMLGTVSAAEGAVARHLLMRQAVEQLDRHYSFFDSMKPEMGDEIIRGLGRREALGGSSVDVDYAFAELYAGSRGRLDTTGEAANRSQRSSDNRRFTAEAFSAVAAVPGEQAGPGVLRPTSAGSSPHPQRVAAVTMGIAPDTNLPIRGMRTVEAREGWSFLVDVLDPVESSMQGERVVIEREHKVVPTEVVDYLLAARQHYATLGSAHMPEHEGASIGDAGVRRGGVEEGDASSEARYIEGESDPDVSDQARSLRTSLGAAEGQMRRWGLRPDAEQSGGLTRILIADLGGYLDRYFEQEAVQRAEVRIATVLVIAAEQFGARVQADQLLSPARIADVVRQALVISGISTGLSLVGPLGRIASRGFSAYMSANGVSEIAAVQGLVSFMMLASEASSLHTARVRARLVSNFLSDAQELIDSIVSRPVTAAVNELGRYAQSTPRTPRELADFCRPLLANPEARAQIEAGVAARLSELEARGIDPLRPSDEYLALRSFQEQLEGHARGESVLGDMHADLPIRQSQDVEDGRAAMSSRTLEARAELVDALGDYRSLPLVENPALQGTSVHVVYRDGIMRVEIGPRAEARHVRGHVETVRQLRRYEGFVGRIRRFRDRLLTALRLMPGYGTEGFEARLEVQKLRGMIWELQGMQSRIDERASRLSSDAERAADRAERAAIETEIAGLSHQLLEFEGKVNSFENGRGFIAADDATIQAAQARLEAAERAREAQDRTVEGSRTELERLRGVLRTGRDAVRAAEARVEEARQYYDAFKDDNDAATRDQVTNELADARAALAQAQATRRTADSDARAQQDAISTAETRLFRLREREVDVAQERLDLDLAGLYAQRVGAYTGRQAAESDTRRLREELGDAQDVLRRAETDARRQPGPSLREYGEAAVKDFLQAREDSLVPFRGRVRELTAQLRDAQEQARQHREAYDLAHEEIAARQLEFERRQAAAIGITPQTYDRLRGKTPSRARQTEAQRAMTDAIYGTPIQGTPQADHIVSMFEIVRMRGFNQLRPEQQEAILNDPANFWALDSRVNASKGHRTLRQWQGHPDSSVFPTIPPDQYDALIAREDDTRTHLQGEIQRLLDENNASTSSP